MLNSMTGFGKSSVNVNGKKIEIQIRSLNSRNNDVNIKTPLTFKEKEIELRQLITKNLIRGKIDCIISLDYDENADVSLINEKYFKAYTNQLLKLTSDSDIPKSGIIESVMRIPQVLSPEKSEINVEEWNAIKAAVLDAVKEMKKFRATEGDNLKTDILFQLENIKNSLETVKEMAPLRKDAMKNHIQNLFNQQMRDEKIDKVRFEEELIYYLEKYDITEEIIRLKSHLSGFKSLVNEEANAKGKKMGFYAQEIGREINTIGSKAYHADIQKIVVNMKDNLEKIKEQILNIL